MSRHLPKSLATLLPALAFSTLVHADLRSLEASKATARRIAEATCPLLGMVKGISKLEAGSPGYQVMQLEIDKESKSLEAFKAQEIEKLRALAPQITDKERGELNQYIETVVAKACEVAKR